MIFESWDAESLDVSEPSGDPGKRRKRRRRRRGNGEGDDRPSEGEPRDVREPQDMAPPRGDGARPRGRRLVREDADAPGVAIPSSGKMVQRPRIHKKRWKPTGGTARRRVMSRVELDDLLIWFQKLPEPILTALYKAMGGQMGRGIDADRMIQLTVRALAQGNRLGGLLSQVHQRDRQALAALNGSLRVLPRWRFGARGDVCAGRHGVHGVQGGLVQ